jgi:preprotein translocase subunit SecG
MGWLNSLLIVIQVLCALSIVVLILLQHGKGADMGAAFGSGASGSLFGASGSANFLSRSTAVLAFIFFSATIGLAYTATAARSSSAGGDRGSVMSTVGKGAGTPAGAPAAPAAPGETPASAPQSGAAPATATAPAAPAGTAPAPAAPAGTAPANRPADIPK